MSKKAYTPAWMGRLPWEALALALLVVGSGLHLALPYYDELLSGRRPDEILIRMYIKESGGFQPDVVTVRGGAPVRLVLMAMDVSHSFVVPELGIDSGPVHPGTTKVIQLEPLKPGVYRFYCLTSCSPTHTFMNGRLVVK